MVSMQPCDLTKPPECQALVDFAVHTFGRIDVHFNNAAMDGVFQLARRYFGRGVGSQSSE
jgi:NAD(P)-dependent dehydrogenase (short-subunit alcohol dehydrogenase family)